MATARRQRQNPRQKPDEPGNPQRTRLLLFALVIVAALLVGYASRLQDLASAEAEVIAQREKVEWAKQRNAELQDELERVQSDAYVAQVARSELGMSQPGDEVFIPLEQDAPRTVGDGSAGPDTPEGPDASNQEEHGWRIFDLNWWRSLFR
ncbi:MAG: septum formation initiator family protein [Caldilineae bacterium]|nr:MAG: septum formation initiator family protein [Caldilineae bacterium]